MPLPAFARLGRTALALGALAAAPSLAGAQYFGRNKVQYEKYDFRVLRTPHFDLHYYPEAEEVTRDAGRQAERWYLRHSTTLGHVFDRRPLVAYANIPDFLQTNVTQIGDESTGGVTTGSRERVVYRFTGVPADDDHVLGHELVHVFQYDIALRTTRGLQSIGSLPLWFIEGMAEYLSVGREDPATAVWLRDAVLRKRIPTIKQLTTDRRFFPYRYGQALMAFIGARYGDARVNDLYRAALRTGHDAAIKRVLGISSDSLSRLWAAQIRADYEPLVAGRTLSRDAGRRVLATAAKDGEYNLGPALSPDGKYVALFASRDLFGIELFLADAATGKVVRKLSSVASDDHLDAVSFLYSSGSFSPDGREFAFVVYADGDNELRVVNVQSGRTRRVRARGVDAITTIAWSPDGRYIAIAGQKGAIGDLFLLDVASGAVRALTDDRFADLQPAWSPDGRTIAFASDRPATSFQALSYQPMRISLLDVATGEVRPIPVPADSVRTSPSLTAGVQAINPQFSPDGASVYYVSDRGGFQDVYRTELGTGALYQVTRLATGVTGIAALSPALTVARQSGRMMFSVFDRQGYQVYGLDSAQAQGTPVPAGQTLAAGGALPPMAEGTRGLVSLYLRTPQDGLPPADTVFTERGYGARLGIEAIGQPSIGVGTSSFGTLVGGNTSAYFSDLLGNRNLAVGLQANGTLKDIGGQLQYFNVERRWVWGGSVGRIPYLTGGQALVPTTDPNVFTYQRILQRIYIDQASGTLQYPFSTTRRVELNPGVSRYTYDSEVQEYFVDRGFNPLSGVRRRNAPEYDADAVTVAQVGLAFVGDNSFGGFVSPIAGQRYRFEVTPTFGTLQYQTALADYRRYFFARPVTFAFRGTHFGRYGGDASNGLLFPLYLGQGTLVRGYEYNSVVNECLAAPGADGECPVYSRLVGSRVAVAGAEIRVPLLGSERLGLIRANLIPVEVAPFVDAGVAWSANDNPSFRFDRETSQRVPVVSTGIAIRTNLLGFAIAEAYYAYPFQRPNERGHWGFNLSPGW